MKELSPAVQAVCNAAETAQQAYWEIFDKGIEDGDLSSEHEMIAAAAIRAAADQSRRGPEHWEGSQPDDWDRGWEAALGSINSIAAELENYNV
jgi:hypothetical protein